MDKKKNNKGSIWLIILIILLIEGISAFIFYEKFYKPNKGNLQNNETKTTLSTTTTTTIKEEIIEDTLKENINTEHIDNEKINIDIDFNEQVNYYIPKRNYLEFSNEDLFEYSKGKYINTLSINNINLDNSTHTVKIKNFTPSNAYSCEKDIDKVLYFDDKVIYAPYGEACYLTSLQKLIVLNNKYVLIHYWAEGGGFLFILDKNGNTIDLKNNIKTTNIIYIKNNSIIYEGLEENSNVINLYKLELVNNEFKNTMLEEEISKIYT